MCADASRPCHDSAPVARINVIWATAAITPHRRRTMSPRRPRHDDRRRPAGAWRARACRGRTGAGGVRGPVSGGGTGLITRWTLHPFRLQRHYPRVRQAPDRLAAPAAAAVSRPVRIRSEPREHARIGHDRVVPFGCFDDLGDVRQARIGHDAAKHGLAQMPLTNELVAVAMGAESELRVVQMHHMKAIEPYDVIEP